jgi:hypothetical protein
MSRETVDSACYIGHGGQLPIRWSSPEGQKKEGMFWLMHAEIRFQDYLSTKTLILAFFF